MKTFHIHPLNALENNYIWVIINQHNGSALIVDPGEAAPVIAYLNQHHLTLKGILITHHHWDHVNGVVDILKTYPVPVFGSTQSLYKQITHPIPNNAYLTVNADFPSYQVLAIPGHTLDHVAYYADGALFCGDTLFAGGCGRLFEGTAEQLYTSLQKIADLPNNTAIYCAHEYTLHNLNFARIVDPTNLMIPKRIKAIEKLYDQKLPSLPSTLGEEKQTNPFLRCHIPDLIKQVESYCGHSLTTPVTVFSELRKWKDHF